jgi:hypothetical protein
MVGDPRNIIDFQHGPISGAISAGADADVDLDFSLRRGLRFAKQAEAHIEGSLKGTIGTSNDPGSAAAATAAVTASIGTSQRTAFAAQYGVNGLWAEACAAAEARARIDGHVTVTTAMLEEALRTDTLLPESDRGRLDEAVLAPALALLRGIELHAGVFAEMYFAFRGRARMMVVGSVIPQEGNEDGAGVSIHFDYGYAYFWGAGVSGYVDFDLPDAGQVLAAVAQSILGETERLLPPSTPPEVRSLLKMVVPLAASAGVAVGQALGAPDPAFPATRQPTGDPVVELLLEFRKTGLTVALTALLEAGMDRLEQIIGEVLDPIALTPDIRDAGREALGEANGFAKDLESAATVTDALIPIAGMCDRLAQFTQHASHVDGFPIVTDGLTVTTAAGGLLQLVLGGDPLPNFPPATADRILERLNITGRGLAIADLVTYLGAEAGVLGRSPLESVRWLLDITDTAGPDLIGLLWHLGEDPDVDGRRSVAAALLQGLVAQVGQRLRPCLDDLPTDSPIRPLAAFIEPLLDVVEVALLPAVNATGSEASARSRDELDTLLTGLFGAIVLRCLQHVIRPFFAQGRDQLRALADRLEGSRDDPVFAEFFRLVNERTVVFRLTPKIVITGLREAADVITLADGTTFESVVKLTRAFVLLPTDTQERRNRLQKLAEGDQPPIGNSELLTGVLEALLKDTTGFAVGLVGPSMRMTTLVALEQGLGALEVLSADAREIVKAAGEAIEAAVAVGDDVDAIVTSLLTRGEVTAEQLRHLAGSLRTLIEGADQVAEAVLDAVKDFTWPLFVISTGGLGVFLRDVFDAFFDGADWVRERIRDALVVLSDTVVEAVIAIAQGAGALDDGEGDDLGALGTTVRQATLGSGDDPGLDMSIGAGSVRLGHAELATMAANVAFASTEVRNNIHALHAAGTDQAATARQVVMVRQAADQADQVEETLKKRLAARQRPTGAPMTIEVAELWAGSTHEGRADFDVVVTGAGPAFVTGVDPQVKIEVGGWPVQVDPAGWWIDAEETMHGQIAVIADASLDAPHPFVAEGHVSIGPQAASVQDTNGQALTAEARAVHTVLEQQVARIDASADPLQFLTVPLSQADGQSPGRAPAVDSFLPPVLRSKTAQLDVRFPGVLALDRQAMIAASDSAQLTADLQALPGTPQTAFVAGNEFANLGRNGTPDTFTAEGTTPQTAIMLAEQMLATDPPAAAGRFPVRIVALARPGSVVVTACVQALPTPQQQADGTAPRASLPEATWFALEPGTRPEPDDDSVCTRQPALPATTPKGTVTTVRITMQNIGTSTWTGADGYRLGRLLDIPDAGVGFGPDFVDLPQPAVEPLGSVTFTVPVTASEAGTVTLSWKMVHDRPGGLRKWFGTATVETVLKVPAPATVTDGAELSWRVRPPAEMTPSTTATVVVTATNTGTSTWTDADGYRLTVDGVVSTPANNLGQPVSRPAAKEFTFTVTAPQPSGGTMRCQMVHGATRFSAALASTIKVRREVTVPYVRGSPLDDAVKKVRGAGLEPVTVGDENGDDPFVGEQKPAAGNRLPEGSQVVLTLRSPPKPLSPGWTGSTGPRR